MHLTYHNDPEDDRPDRPAQEILITPDMLAAGVSALLRHNSDYATDGNDALNVFIAMAEAGGFKVIWSEDVERGS